MQLGILDIEDTLTSAPIHIMPDWSQPFELMYDASGVVVGTTWLLMVVTRRR